MRWPWKFDASFGQSPFDVDAKPDSFARRIIWLITALVLLSGLAVASSLYYFRDETLVSGEKLMQSLVQVIEEQTSRTFQTVDQRLQLAGSLLQALDAEKKLTGDSARTLLREQLQGLPFLRAIWVLDLQGRIIYDSDVGNAGLSLADREYFRIYQQTPATEFHLSAPVRSRSTGNWLVSASRPLRGPGKSVTGVMVAAVEPPYFEALWRGIDLGPSGAIALFRRDCVLMMRSPAEEASKGKTFPALPLFTQHLPKSPFGIFPDPSPIDGLQRINAYRSLSSYPDLVVVVGSLYDEILGPWKRFATLAALIWLAAAATVTLLSIQLYWYARQRQRTELQFRQLAQAMPQIVFISDAKGMIRFFNDQWQEVTGCPTDAGLGTGWTELIHPDERKAALEKMSAMRLSESVIEHEHRLRCRDGVYRWRLVRAAPNRDSSGKLVSWYGTSTDVDALKQAEARLTAQADLLAMAGRLSHVGGWQVDLASQHIVWSDEAAAILDLPPGESPTLDSILGMCTPISREITAQAVGGCLADGTPFDVEVEMLTPTGRHIWVRSMGQAVRDGNGLITGMQGAQQDVTTRVQTERTLQGYLRTLQRAADAALAITQHQQLDAVAREVADQTRIIIGANRAVLELAGDADGAHGVKVVSLQDQGPQTPVAPGQAGDNTLEVSLTGRDGVTIGTLQLYNKHGGPFAPQDVYVAKELAQLGSIAIDNVRLLAEIRELNTGLEEKVAQRTRELAHQEALFRTLAKQAPQPIWTVDPRGCATYFSKAWYGLFGGSPPDWHGMGWLALVHPDDEPGMSKNWVRACQTLSLFSGIRRLKAHDGSWHSMSYQASPVFNEAGEVDFWVGLDVDVTETKAIKDALRLSNAELEAFSYSVSHDLRSPLTTVDGFSHLLRKALNGHEGAKVKHYMDRIQQGVARMGQLIEGLLSLAQVTRVELRRAPVDLSAMAHDILERRQATDRKRVVRYDVEPGMTVEGDSRLISSVMENLLANAWKFSAKQPEARISVGRVAPGGAFFVRDNGAGFDMAYADKLFGTFQRLHDAADYAGTGIGLATVSRIIARHSGQIWADSAPNAGATFYFTLPTSDA